MSYTASGPGLQTFILIGVLVLALIFVGLVWLFVRLSKNSASLQPRNDAAQMKQNITKQDITKQNVTKQEARAIRRKDEGPRT
jgi:flagellar basal body-associated protein FliL